MGGGKAQVSAAPDGIAASRKPNPGARGNGQAGVLGPERVVEIQRARLLAAMVEVSAERGAANVSVANVVERAGVSRRTFYELFNDREDCFLAAFDDAMARVSRHVLDAYDPGAKWVGRVRTALIAALQFLDVERGAGQLLVVGSLGAGHRALERRRRGIAQIISLIDQGRTESKAGQELPPLTAEGIVGGVLSVLHARLLDSSSPTMPGVRQTDGEGDSLLRLAGPLMSMIVLPYLGPAAARRELARPAPPVPSHTAASGPDPLRELRMRLTYRTVRVLLAVAATPGGSNRQVADESGIGDQGQISKLLARLHGLGLIENTGSPTTRGAPNAWILTDRGWEVQAALARNSGGGC
jgi:AcrR family transcriptional regulator/DNA-binding MarR family transcriptional regulator